jgi:hypothetical protein
VQLVASGLQTEEQRPRSCAASVSAVLAGRDHQAGVARRAGADVLLFEVDQSIAPGRQRFDQLRCVR